MKKIIGITVLLFVCIMDIYATGPWPRKKNGLYAQLGFYAVTPTARLWGTGFKTRLLNRPVFDGTAQLYAEYGITDKLTVFTSLPLRGVFAGKSVSSDDSTAIAAPDTLLSKGILVGMGNYELGGKYTIVNKDGFVFAAFANFSAPTGVPLKNKVLLATDLRTAYPTWGIMPGLAVGYGSAKIYTYLDAGFNFRTHGYSHEFIGNFEFGYKLFDRIYLGAALNARFPLAGKRDIPEKALDDQAIHTGLYINNQHYLALTIKAHIPFNEQLGMHLSLSGGLMSNHIQQAPSIGLGFYYKMEKASS
ncbi:MAG: hypothetical protein GY810_31230 [Aureispira sp.]|nr:hypothetical protein [Aureispira sp.]